jgi:ribosomal protein L15|tara:strand:+ start:477 stop:884 length:408 start_codon:yes stop_codon:yes gene_type:complete
MIMELKWTKHAIKRGYTRLGRYGMDIIEEKILQNIDNATVSDEDNKAIIPFKLGKKKCVAIVMPTNEDGSEALIISMFPVAGRGKEGSAQRSYMELTDRQLKRHRDAPRLGKAGMKRAKRRSKSGYYASRRESVE